MPAIAGIAPLLPTSASMKTTLNIRGIKLSTELILVRVPPNGNPSPAEIIRRLAAERINLTCVVLDRVEDHSSGAFCIEVEDLPHMQKVLADLSDLLQIKRSVGTLTLFPHGGRLDLLAIILRAVGGCNIPLLAVASSMSTLTVALPYQRLDEAVEEICRFVCLPANHAPFRPQFRVRQV